MDTNELCGDWSIPSTCNYIVTKGFTRVALQFPDELLHDAPLVAAALQVALAQRGSPAKVMTITDRSCMTPPLALNCSGLVEQHCYCGTLQ